MKVAEIMEGRRVKRPTGVGEGKVWRRQATDFVADSPMKRWHVFSMEAGWYQ